MTAATGGRSSGRGTWLLVAALLVAVVLLVVLTGRQAPGTPFGVSSSAPDGYRALAILLRDRGSTVVSTTAERARRDGTPAGQVLVVPAPELLTGPELTAVRDAARGGAVVVLGTDVDRTGTDDLDIVGRPAYSARDLADTPAAPVRPGGCDLPELAGVGSIDGAFADTVGAQGQVCYGDPSGVLVRRESLGSGSVVTLGSPYLWVNARLQPAKESGGRPLGNATMALRLLGPPPDGATAGTRITFVDAVATPGVDRAGTRSPIELLPLGVKLAVLQLVAAFVLYAWWRSRRLGPPVAERVPVRIAGSELVAAVGDLLRRRGSPGRAASVLRAEARRELGRRVEVPPGSDPSALVAVVVSRTGRDAGEVGAALLDHPVGSAEELVRIANTIDAIRQEVLHGHPVS